MIFLYSIAVSLRITQKGRNNNKVLCIQLMFNLSLQPELTLQDYVTVRVTLRLTVRLRVQPLLGGHDEILLSFTSPSDECRRLSSCVAVFVGRTCVHTDTLTLSLYPTHYAQCAVPARLRLVLQIISFSSNGSKLDRLLT